MKNRLFALGIILHFTIMLFAQTNKPSEASLTDNTTKYIIGIGNDDVKMFNEVLADLQASATIKVYAYCEKNRVIGLVVNNNNFINGYDSIRDFLLSEYTGLNFIEKVKIF